MKKFIVLSSLFVLAVFLTGCGVKKPLMDKPAADNNYYYKNEGLGFSLVLPPEFIYYQTQRKQIGGATELAIFVPTADTQYQQEVPGYAKPLRIMIYGSDDWRNLPEADKINLEKVGEKKDRIYAIEYWQKAPSDWQDKWNEQLKNRIIEGFKAE
ncbi:MAG: hypothetical protein Q8O93_00775 [bacterium]|nr:hypothetical protein [bacterium]